MFQTPEQLEADLRRLETKEADTIVQKLIVQLYPFLSTVQQFFVLLAVITPPVTIEKTLFLGLLHMIITVRWLSYKISVFAHKIRVLFARLPRSESW